MRVDLLGDDADDVWGRARAARSEGTLRCKGCDGRLSTRDPVNRSRHFFHVKGSDDCPLGGRTSEAHVAAQKAVAAAVRRSGGTAEIEWVSAGRSFVADVLGVWDDGSAGSHRVVFEIQVSSQNRDRTIERDAVREAQADITVWVLLAKPSEDDSGLVSAGWAHWSTEVPSILLLEDATSAGFWADELDGTDPSWSLTSVASLVDAVGHRAAFLPAQRPWERGGWTTPELLQERERRLDLKREKEEAQRRERERYRQNREAFAARVKSDLDVLKGRLAAAGHSPRVREGGPMFGHATLVTAGSATYAVMPAANQIWSADCRRNLAATTVVASDEADQRRLRGVEVTAVAAADAPLPPAAEPSAGDNRRPSPGPPSHAAPVPTQRSEPPTPTETRSRRERRERRDAEDRERARLAAAARHVADLSRRQTHLRETAERLGLAVGDIETDDGWIRAEVAGRLLLIIAGGTPPPAPLRATAVIWCDSQRQAARFEADGWTTILQLSEVLQVRPDAEEVHD